MQMHTYTPGTLVLGVLRADAFTVGNNVVFAAERYNEFSPEGRRLIAHELVQVVQQGAAPPRGRAAIRVRERAPLAVQRHVDPARMYEAVCPDGSTPTSHPSSRIIGTAYGNWLGVMYMQELARTGRPKTYGIVDFEVYTGSSSWEPGMIFGLHKVDALVGRALVLREWAHGWRRQRTDILTRTPMKSLRSSHGGRGSAAKVRLNSHATGTP
jgi:hypothetical protein